MSTTPVAGNQYYVGVENTIVSPGAVNAANQQGGLAQWKERIGKFTPTAAGNYAVLDDAGNSIQLPAGAVIVALVMSADVTLVGGTSVQASLGVTSGTSTTTQTGAITTAQVNAGFGCPLSVASGVVSATASYLTGVTLGTYTAGVCRFRVYYVETSPV